MYIVDIYILYLNSFEKEVTVQMREEEEENACCDLLSQFSFKRVMCLCCTLNEIACALVLEILH